MPSRCLAFGVVLCAAACSLCDAETPAAPSRLAQVLPWIGPADGAAAPGELVLRKGDTIVAIGDSITQAGGYLRDIDAALAALYPDLQLAKIVNTGISGQKAENLVARFQKDVVDRKPAVATISIGINDVWHRLKAPHDDAVLKAYRENVAKMVDLAQAAGIRVILLTPTVIQEDPAAEGNRRLPLYVDAMKSIAREKPCGLADLHALFLEALAHKPADVKGHWLTTDGVHMGPRGNAVMAAGVLRALGVPDTAIATVK